MAAATDTDTIVAVATAPGRGGIGVVRVSGLAASHISQLFLAHQPQPRYAHYCDFTDVRGEIIDRGLLLYFPGPASYTGEDMIELHAHGSRIVLEQIVNRIVTAGARRARPGEFTERAFINHKIDLIQAEAIADLIDAGSEQAARSAIRSLTGEFSRAVKSLLDSVIQIRVKTEGALDFPEEDTGAHADQATSEALCACINDLDTLLKRTRLGVVLRQGVNVVIAGRPNAGKSTLLNRITGEDAAIVSETAGTTRDLIERSLLLDGIPLHIVDTAGLRFTGNVIEQEGIRRAKEAAARADLIILVVEHDQQPGEEEQDLLRAAGGTKAVITVYNKIDLVGDKPVIISNNNTGTAIRLSARTGAGIELLVNQLKNHMGQFNMDEDAYMARKRHVDALKQAQQALSQALRSIEKRAATELLAEDLRQAQQALNEVTGEFAADDLLGEIFRNFCIGK